MDFFLFFLSNMTTKGMTFMQNHKILEMINQGRIEELKEILRDEIYQDALKTKHGCNRRYSAMKKYFGYVKTTRAVCSKPSIIEFEGGTVTSFCNSYSLALTSEPCGGIELFTDADGNYPNVGRLVNREGEPRPLDIRKVIAEAKGKGYRLTKSEVNGNHFMMHYNGAYFRLGLIDATYSIIDDGEIAIAYHNGNKVSPIVLENDIGICLILPVKCDGGVIENSDTIIIEA